MAGKLHYGHGSFWLNGRSTQSHRISWELKNGPIPDGLNALHKCDKPPCVNPGHLFLGTHKDNTDDMISKGRSWAQKLDGRTHCKYGHDLRIERNFYKYKKRRVVCDECRRVLFKKYKESLQNV